MNETNLEVSNNCIKITSNVNIKIVNKKNLSQKRKVSVLFCVYEIKMYKNSWCIRLIKLFQKLVTALITIMKRKDSLNFIFFHKNIPFFKRYKNIIGFYFYNLCCSWFELIFFFKSGNAILPDKAERIESGWT